MLGRLGRQRVERIPRIPGIDILPEEYRGVRLTSTERGVLVLVALMFVASLVFARTYLAARSDTAVIQAESRRVAAERAKLAPQVQAGQILKQDIGKLDANLVKAKQARAALPPQRDWDSLLLNSLVSLPAGVRLTSLTTATGGLLKIDGSAQGGFPAMQQYYGQLASTPGVASVTVNKATLQGDEKQGTFLAFSLTLTLAGAK